jgi:Bacterial TniB protein
VKVPLSSAESMLIHYRLFDAAVARLENAFASWGRTADPDCVPIIGPSRSGKSRLLNHFHELHPDVDHDNFIEKPFVLCDVPSRPTVNGMAEKLLFALGDPLWDSGTKNVKTNRILTLLKKARTRMLALDNFHHFVDTERERIPYEVADWLKEIFDDKQTHVSIVVAGLKRMNTVLLQNEQLRGRFSATVNLGPFRWPEEGERRAYRGILMAIQKDLSSTFTVTPALSDSDIAKRIGIASYGLMGYTMRLIRRAARIAVQDGTNTINRETLSTAYMVEIWQDRPTYPNPFAEGVDVQAAPWVDVPEEIIPTSQTRRRSPKPVALSA